VIKRLLTKLINLLDKMEGNKNGLYTGPSEDSFKSKAQIVTENYTPGKPVFRKPHKLPPDGYEYWREKIMLDQESAMEVCDIDKEGSVEIPTDIPINLAFMGDIHSGSIFFAHKLMDYHFQTLKNVPNSYLITLGDLTDSLFWGRGQHEQVQNANNQYRYMLAALDWLGPDKILAGWRGQHDAWAGEQGTSIYFDWHKRFNAYYFEGPSVLKIKVGNIEYNISGCHNWRGNSMYNDTHAENRASKFGIQGCDMYIGGDTHKKSISVQSVRTADGFLPQYFINVGPYKYSDEYSRYKGFVSIPEAEETLGLIWVTLYPDRKSVVAHKTTQEMMELNKQYLELP